MALTVIVLDQRWVTIVLAYGFVAHVLTGPKLSPLGQLVTRVLTPRLPSEPVTCPARPSGSRQAIGVAFSVTALILTYGFHTFWAARLSSVLLLSRPRSRRSPATASGARPSASSCGRA